MPSDLYLLSHTVFYDDHFHFLVQSCHTLESLLKLPQGEEIAKKLVIVTSDFLRTLETAKIIHEHFQVIEPLRLNPALRERGFGSYHLAGESSAFGIFKRDYEDPTHRDSGCESLMDMVLRISKLLQSLDDEFNDRILLLVSHGDPIQALCAICSGFPPGERWTRLPNIGNCGIRELPNSCN